MIFDILNVAYLAGILLSSITLAPEGETPMSVEKDSFVQVSFYREWWREDGRGKCTYKGAVVPYTRTWAEEIQTGGNTTVLPPEPDKIAGYVAVVTSKECVDQAPVPILRAGLARPHKLFFGPFQLDKSGFFAAGDMLEAGPDKTPPWLPQVLERIALIAQTDQGAKSFLEASAAQFSQVTRPRPASAEKTAPTEQPAAPLAPAAAAPAVQVTITPNEESTQN